MSDNCSTASTGCCSPRELAVERKVDRKLLVELLYIDRHVCTRCQGADEALDAAIESTAHALRAIGVEIDARRILVETEEMAERLRLTTSPTIRVNGRDIQPAVEESACESCGELVTAGKVDCRVWNWRGRQYASPPEGLIVEALMLAAITPASTQASQVEFVLPDNLRRFFKNRNPKTSGCSSAQA